MKKIVMFVAALFLFASCASIGRKHVEKIGDVGSDEIIVVGKIMLHPSLGEKEQQIGWGFEAYKYRINILNGAGWRNIDPEKIKMTGGEWADVMNVDLDTTFYVAMPRKDFYTFMSCIFLKYYTQTTSCGYNCTLTTYFIDPFYLPLEHKVKVNADDRAVYVGTVHYYRDEFNKLTKVVYEDNYEQEKGFFREKFGDIPLVKSLYGEVTAQDKANVSPEDEFAGSGVKLYVSLGPVFNITGNTSYVNLGFGSGYQPNRNLLISGGVGIFMLPDFSIMGFEPPYYVGNGISFDFINFTASLGAKYFFGSGFFSPYAAADMGYHFSLGLHDTSGNFYLYPAGGVRLSVASSIDVLIELGLPLLNFKANMIMLKVTGLFGWIL